LVLKPHNINAMNRGHRTANKHSATVQSDDIDLVATLRGIAWFCQETGNPMISLRGTGEDAWMANGHHAMFCFMKSTYRDRFLEIATMRFPSGWTLAQRSDANPAPRQS